MNASMTEPLEMPIDPALELFDFITSLDEKSSVVPASTSAADADGKDLTSVTTHNHALPRHADNVLATETCANMPSSTPNTSLASSVPKVSTSNPQSSERTSETVGPASSSLAAGTSRAMKHRPRRRLNGPGDTSTRDRIRELNRKAATKWRHKRDQWARELIETTQEHETRHLALRTEYESLLDEALELKDLLLSHSFCGDPAIDRWMKEAATRFVHNHRDNASNESPPPDSATI